MLFLALVVSACGSSAEPHSGAKKLSFELTDEGCLPHTVSAPAGPVTFEAENTGSSKVTEIELMKGEEVLGEKENLTEGLPGNFTLTLGAGKYTVYCPGGDNEKGTLTVTGELEAKGSAKADKAVAAYREYLENNTVELVTRTKMFTDAVIAGDLNEAKATYVAARSGYERIEPVAESIGDLDSRIDARENEVSEAQFEGFHRIEKALWAEDTTNGMAPVARRLQRNVEALDAKVGKVKLQAVQIANGANELLDEISTSKISGEEERYSHTDLYDFQENVEGAESALEALEPLLDESRPKLSRQSQVDYMRVLNALQPYYRPDGSFVSYTKLTQADTRKLARSIDTFAEKLSQVPAAIAQAEHG